MAGPVSKKSAKDKSAEHAESPAQEPSRRITPSSPQADILALQRAAGNPAVSQLLQSSTDSQQSAVRGIRPVVEEGLKSSSGRPLDPSTRSFMEAHFGQDFSQVRVHTDAKAAASAQAIDAAAYTVGWDVVFEEGKYQPETVAGKRLLAHELAHVVQQVPQTGRNIQPSGRVSMNDPSDSYERVADSIATAVVADTQPIGMNASSLVPASLGETTRSASVQVQRRKGSARPTKKLSSASKERQRDYFIKRIIPAMAHVISQYDSFKSKIEAQAVQYHQAWECHTKVLNEAKVQERLIGENILDAALAFIPGGIAGVVGKWISKLKGFREYTNAFIADGVKDLLKIPIRSNVKRAVMEAEGYTDTPQPGLPGPAYEAIKADNPSTWRGTLIENMLEEKSHVLALLEFWSDEATRDVTNEGYYNWDPLEVIKKAIKVDGVALENLPKPTEQDALIIEKGFWKGWIETHRFFLKELKRFRGPNVWVIMDRMPAGLAGSLSAYLAGREIRKRIADLADELREDSDAWLQQWGVESWEKLEEERVKRNPTFWQTIFTGKE